MLTLHEGHDHDGSGMRKFTDEFKREAVRLVQTSGRSIVQVADDLGVGKSTLGK